jgi:hypothetical protein
MCKVGDSSRQMRRAGGVNFRRCRISLFQAVGARLAGTGSLAATGLLLLLAAPWLCAVATPAPEWLFLTTTLAQAIWAILWILRCKSHWHPSEESTPTTPPLNAGTQADNARACPVIS